MENVMESQSKKNTMQIGLLFLNVILVAIGNCAGPLITRLYFLHGGKRIWFSSWLQTSAWPITLIPITICYLNRRLSTESSSHSSKFFLMKRRVFFAAAIIGTITGSSDYLYAYGASRLPTSTSTLIISSQLVFTAAFAFFLVKQKFTSFSTNAVFLLTIGAVVLALHSSSDRPYNESTRQYLVGFLMTLGAAILIGLSLPLVELTYKMAKQEINYALVLEIQMVMCLFATLFCTVGMVMNNDFQAIGREAKVFSLGEAKYYAVVVMSSLVWQCSFLGMIGVVFCGSSLLCAIIVAGLLPATEILAVIFYKENFSSGKGVSLALCLWGFASYFYGEVKHEKKNEKKKKNQIPAEEMPQQILPNHDNKC